MCLEHSKLKKKQCGRVYNVACEHFFIVSKHTAKYVCHRIPLCSKRKSQIFSFALVQSTQRYLPIAKRFYFCFLSHKTFDNYVNVIKNENKNRLYLQDWRKVFGLKGELAFIVNNKKNSHLLEMCCCSSRSITKCRYFQFRFHKICTVQWSRNIVTMQT